MSDVLSKKVQLQSMLTGRSLKLVKEQYPEANEVTFGRYLTIERADLIRYLRRHPLLTRKYAYKHNYSEAYHDVYAIKKQNGIYLLGWLDHGKLSNPKRFNSLADVVAEHILVEHGLFQKCEP